MEPRVEKAKENRDETTPVIVWEHAAEPAEKATEGQVLPFRRKSDRQEVGGEAIVVDRRLGVNGRDAVGRMIVISTGFGLEAGTARTHHDIHCMAA